MEWLGLDNLSSTVSMAMEKSWKVTPLAWLGLDNLSATVSVALAKAWDGTALAALGISALSAVVSIGLALTKTAQTLWNEFKAAWDSAAETLKIKVELDYSGTDGFGGATGGGGSTSGGGAGRSIKVPVEPETTVGGKTFWERAKEAIDAAGTAVDKGLDVIVRPALNSAGERITSIVQWLFGNNNTPDVTTKVNGTAGTGFSSVNGNTFAIGGITGGNVTVNGTPGAGFEGKLSGTNKYTLAGIEAANVDINGKLNPTNDASSAFKTGAALEFKANMTVNSGQDANSKFKTGTPLAFGANMNVNSGNDANAKFKTGTPLDFKARLTGQTGDSKTPAGVFGSAFNVQSRLTGKTGDSNTLPGVFGSFFNVQSKLTGKTEDSKTNSQVHGGEFGVKSKLTGKTDDTKTLKEVHGDEFGVKSKLTKKTDDSKTLKEVHGDDFTVKSKLKGKTDDSKSLTEVFGSSFDVKASLDSKSAQRLKSAATKALKGIKVTVKAKSDSGGAKLEVQKNGGAILPSGQQIAFANGGFISSHIVQLFSNIPRYAGGTTNAHGTMFLAGEAGPEIIGHVGGRTEILNQSQLAQTMFAAVRSAMGGVKIAATMYDGGDSGEADYEMMYRAMYDAFTDAMAGSAERDREKVALMREIAAKEFTAEVTANSVNRAQTRMNRRAGTTIVPVGT